jgi:uncharacterized protein (TIGR02594 family)
MVGGYLDSDLDRCPWMRTALLQWGIRDIYGLRTRIGAYLSTVDDPLTTPTIAWCSAFVNWCMQQNRIRGTGADSARSWLPWGTPLAYAEWGCVTVLSRDSAGPGAGHVGFLIDKDPNSGRVSLLGGNQSNQVMFRSFPTDGTDGYRLLGYRWPPGKLIEATA